MMYGKSYIESPFGIFEISGSSLGIRSVKLVERKEKTVSDPSGTVAMAATQLKEYFQKKRTQFDLPLDWADAPEFHKKVWEELLKIPYGRTTSYGSIAEKLGDKNAMRAVGQANRNNPIAIIVPCHRVVAKSGELQGYFYGLDMKQQLLELENPLQFGMQGKLF